MSSTNKLIGVQMARGLAAIMVVVYHSGRLLSLPQYLGRDAYDGLFRFGHAGVDFFFVLSGFIIYYIHGRDIGERARLGHYLWRRVTRIYPIYWVVLAMVLATSLFSGHLLSEFTDTDILASFLLVFHDKEPILGVAWTLEHEVLFYAIFALLILKRRVGYYAFALWVIVICVNIIRRRGGVLEFVGSPYHIDFFLGILAARLSRSSTMRRLPHRSVMAFGIAAFLAVGMAENAHLIPWSGTVSVALFGVSATTLLIGIVGAELHGGMTIGSPWVQLGAMSYSLYLFHTFVITKFAHLAFQFSIVTRIPPLVFALTAVLAALASSFILHRFIENPMLVRLQDGNVRWPRARLLA